jgi:hypothetical protein
MNDEAIKALFLWSTKAVEKQCKDQTVAAIEIVFGITGYDDIATEIWNIKDANILARRAVDLGLYGVMSYPGQFGKRTLADRMGETDGLARSQWFVPLKTAYPEVFDKMGGAVVKRLMEKSFDAFNLMMEAEAANTQPDPEPSEELFVTREISTNDPQCMEKLSAEIEKINLAGRP